MDSSDSEGDADSRIDTLLQERQQLTDDLTESPYDAILYLRRAVAHTDLAYPDLAVGDAYRALLLTDEARDDSFEYHEQAIEALTQYIGAPLPRVLAYGALLLWKTSAPPPANQTEETRDLLSLSHLAAIRSYQILALSLLLCGCLKSATTFCDRGLAVAPDNVELLETQQYIRTMAEQRLRRSDLNVNSLPDWGVVRREVYPWNTHEPDRFSEQSLGFLNGELSKMAPKCAVQVSQLPVLVDGANHDDNDDILPTCNQLGVFAKEDIAPGEVVLREYSLVTANNRLKDSVCDACSEELPPIGPDSPAVNCADCYDTVFCSQFCHDQAMELYHPAVCEKDVDSIAKDTEAHDADESLHLLLLARVLAMGAHQEIHPLDVTQIKYIWGDFVPTSANEISLLQDAGPPPEWTLPFSFAKNIEQPLHILEKMDIDIYATLAQHDIWVFNTIYAKTRGTASARKSLRDMRPDVAAVHPFWCLANHDCDPNVSWEWGGRMVLWARETRIVGNRPGGIKAGEEIMNHYCDVTLGVQDRREWANGSLGGWCMCQRCRTEAAAAEDLAMSNGT